MIGKSTTLYKNELTKNEKQNAIRTIAFGHKRFANYTNDEFIEIIKEFATMCEEINGTEYEIFVSIEKKVNVPSVNIHHIRELIKSRRNNRLPLDKEVADAIQSLYDSGVSKLEISESLGISRNTVQKYINK